MLICFQTAVYVFVYEMKVMSDKTFFQLMTPSFFFFFYVFHLVLFIWQATDKTDRGSIALS